MQRAVSALRATLPIVHQLLPLLGGTLGAAVSNVLGPYPQTAPHATPINIEPLEDDVAELQTQHRDLRNRLLEHHASLKRVEDQMETVREAADRNAQEQTELAEDLQSMRKTVHRFAMIALAVLVVSLLLNAGLFLHILHVLPWL
jgi:ABC-type multidrug transport system fused ATPase/permease subunit